MGLRHSLGLQEALRLQGFWGLGWESRCRKDGHALHFAAKELLADRDIVLTAVKQKGSAR